MQGNISVLQTALRSVPGADHQLLRQHRVEADQLCQTYLEKKCRAGKELRYRTELSALD